MATRQPGEQILRGVTELQEEHTSSEPLVPGQPVAPHAAAERIGISPVGRWYAAVLKYLEEEEALEPNVCPGDVLGDSRYVLGERGPELAEAKRLPKHAFSPACTSLEC